MDFHFLTFSGAMEVFIPAHELQLKALNEIQKLKFSDTF